MRFLPVMLFLFLVGCKPPDTDVTSSPEYNFSSFSGTVWRTKVKLAVADFKEYTGVHHTYLFVPDRFDPKQPDYRPLPDMHVITVLPPGTHVRIGQLIKDNGIGDQLWVTGTLIDSTDSQQIVYLDHLLLANNRFVELGPSSSTNWGVDTNMLEEP